MASITFTSTASTVGNRLIVRLPAEASAGLPSRGQVMVTGRLNGASFATPIEPDGKGSHWIDIDQDLVARTNIAAGHKVRAELEATKQWPEPVVPDDVAHLLHNDDAVKQRWEAVTPMARWEWLRWINSTKNPATRAHRIEVSRSKLLAGSRRPCCFNRNMCCVPDVSKNGVLLEPSAS